MIEARFDRYGTTLVCQRCRAMRFIPIPSLMPTAADPLHITPVKASQLDEFSKAHAKCEEAS